jgi:hypothetical protein
MLPQQPGLSDPSGPQTSWAPNTPSLTSWVISPETDLHLTLDCELLEGKTGLFWSVLSPQYCNLVEHKGVPSSDCPGGLVPLWNCLSMALLLHLNSPEWVCMEWNLLPPKTQAGVQCSVTPKPCL